MLAEDRDERIDQQTDDSEFDQELVDEWQPRYQVLKRVKKAVDCFQSKLLHPRHGTTEQAFHSACSRK
jgi:hypothetical protein